MTYSKIYVATHKLCKVPSSSIFEPIAIGKNQDNLPFMKDNTKENIADKNPYYCELTALYWIWKNDITNNYIGLNHYHRFFYDRTYIKEVEIKYLLKEYDIIVPKPIFFDCTLYEQYKRHHHIEDLNLTCEELIKRDSTYKDSIRKVLNQNKFYLGNLFVSPKELLDDYASFLFPLLFELEKKIPYLTYSVYNQRVFGFLAERIFNIYIYQKGLDVYPYPIKDTLTFQEKVLKKVKTLKDNNFFK